MQRLVRPVRAVCGQTRRTLEMDGPQNLWSRRVKSQLFGNLKIGTQTLQQNWTIYKALPQYTLHHNLKFKVQQQLY